jgi:hypothetical protein
MSNCRTIGRTAEVLWRTPPTIRWTAEQLFCNFSIFSREHQLGHFRFRASSILEFSPNFHRFLKGWCKFRTIFFFWCHPRKFAFFLVFSYSLSSHSLHFLRESIMIQSYLVGVWHIFFSSGNNFWIKIEFSYKSLQAEIVMFSTTRFLN